MAMNRSSGGGFRTLGPIGVGGGSGGVEPVFPSFTRYASPNGSDSATGTELHPFKTVRKAVEIVNGEGGGSALYSPGTWAQQLVGAGLPLSGLDDLGAGGANWIDIDTSLNIAGVPGPGGGAQFGQLQCVMAPGGGATFFTEPALQICGTQGGLRVANMSVACYLASANAPTFRLGLSSPIPAWSFSHAYGIGDMAVYSGGLYRSLQSPNTNHTPDVSPTFWIGPLRVAIGDLCGASLTANTWFENSSFIFSGVGGWPAVDVGYSFLCYWNDPSFQHFYATAGDDLHNCSIRFYNDLHSGGEGSSPYLQFMQQPKFNVGGLYGAGGVRIPQIAYPLAENLVTPMIHHAPGPNGGAGLYLVYSPENADAITNTLVNEDPQTRMWMSSPSNGTSTGNNVYNSPFPVTYDAMAAGHTGVYGSMAHIRQDTGRRSRPAGVSPYQNNALQFAGTPAVGSDGNMSAFTGSPGFMWETAYGPQALIVGDRLAFGCGIYFDPAINAQGFSIQNPSATSTYSILLNGVRVDIGPGQLVEWLPDAQYAVKHWGYAWGWFEVLAFSGDASIFLSASGAGNNRLENSWAFKIPAGISNAEVASLAIHGGNFPAASVPFGVSNLPVSPPVGTSALPALVRDSRFDQTAGRWPVIAYDDGRILLDSVMANPQSTLPYAFIGANDPTFGTGQAELPSGYSTLMNATSWRYQLGRIARKVTLSLDVLANTMIGGGAQLFFDVLRNGVTIGTVGPYASGSTPTTSVTYDTGETVTQGYYSLQYRSTGVTAAGSNLSFTATLSFF